MKHSDFKVGKEFFTPTGRWQCTDKGRRTIIAIKKDKDDPSWYSGPPYAVAEFAFDEYDILGCVPTYEMAEKEWGESFVKAELGRGKTVSVQMLQSAEKRLKQAVKKARARKAKKHSPHRR